MVDFLFEEPYHAGMTRAEVHRLDAAFGALANQQRRDILVLLRRGPIQTPQIASHFGFSKQAMSRHMAVLEDAGLVNRTVLGRARELTLETKPLDDVSRWVDELQRGWRASFERLDRVLRGLK